MKPSTRRILLELRRVGPVGSTTGVLCRPEVGGARFGARIKELRDAGCVIENVRERQGSDRYWLRSEPAGLLAPPVERPLDAAVADVVAGAPGGGQLFSDLPAVA